MPIRWPPSSVKSSVTLTLAPVAAPGAKASGCWALAAMRATSARPGDVAATVAVDGSKMSKSWVYDVYA